ncbi:hypothetical protein Tco_0303411 [Tanacetum coccineum]
MASRKGRLIWIYLKVDKRRSSSSSFFYFFSRDRKGIYEDLEGWYKVREFGISPSRLLGVSSFLGLPSSDGLRVAEGVSYLQVWRGFGKTARACRCVVVEAYLPTPLNDISFPS